MTQEPANLPGKGRRDQQAPWTTCSKLFPVWAATSQGCISGLWQQSLQTPVLRAVETGWDLVWVCPGQTRCTSNVCIYIKTAQTKVLKGRGHTLATWPWCRRANTSGQVSYSARCRNSEAAVGEANMEVRLLAPGLLSELWAQGYRQQILRCTQHSRWVC